MNCLLLIKKRYDQYLFTHKSPSVAFSWPQANLCDTINRRRAKLRRKASRQFYPFVSFIPKLNCSMVSWRAPNIIQCTFFCLKFFEVVYIVSRSHLCTLLSFNFQCSASFSFHEILKKMISRLLNCWINHGIWITFFGSPQLNI